MYSSSYWTVGPRGVLLLFQGCFRIWDDDAPFAKTCQVPLVFVEAANDAFEKGTSGSCCLRVTLQSAESFRCPFSPLSCIIQITLRSLLLGLGWSGYKHGFLG